MENNCERYGVVFQNKEWVKVQNLRMFLIMKLL